MAPFARNWLCALINASSADLKLLFTIMSIWFSSSSLYFIKIILPTCVLFSISSWMKLAYGFLKYSWNFWISLAIFFYYFTLNRIWSIYFTINSLKLYTVRSMSSNALIPSNYAMDFIFCTKPWIVTISF